MLNLVRTVRFCLTGAPDEAATACLNPYAAWPAMRGLSRYYEIVIHAKGQADPHTGYFLDIRLMDAAVREAALPILRAAVVENTQDGTRAADTPMGALMAQLLAGVQAQLGPCVHRLELRLTPTYTLAAKAVENAPMPLLEVRQHYDFAAAHRLALPTLSDAQNADLFGKCSNPAGHGHNYKVEVVATAAIEADGHSALTRDPTVMDAWVEQALIVKLDHKHLNVDVAAFKNQNPSVEHIAKQAFDWLKQSTPAGCALVEVGVWETEKTRCVIRENA